MNLFKYIEKKIVMPGVGISESRKRTFLSFCFIICIPFVFLFAIEDLKNQRIFEFIIVLPILVLFILNLFALKYVKNITLFYRISVIFTLAPLLYDLAIGGAEGYAFLWFYFFPLAVFYLLGKTEGVFWVSVSLLLSAFFLLSPIFYAYDINISIRFIITYSIVSILSYGLEFSRNWYYRELMCEKEMLEKALGEVKTLQGLLPICSFCKRIRDDKGYWNQIEAYINRHSEAKFSHGVCPECAKKHYPDLIVDEKTPTHNK